WVSYGEDCAPLALPIRDRLRFAAADVATRRVLLAYVDGRLLLWAGMREGVTMVRLPCAAVRLASGPGDHVLALDADGDVHHVHAGRVTTLPRRQAPAMAVCVLPGGVLVTGHRLAWADERPCGEVVARTPLGELSLA